MNEIKYKNIRSKWRVYGRKIFRKNASGNL